MKKRIKKLALSRETLRVLEEDLPKVQGGDSHRPRLCSEDTCTCISWCYQCITDEPSICIC